MSANLPPRRILMTADTVGGVFHYAVELCAQLARRGKEIVLATMGAPLTAGQRRMLARVEGLKLFESHFRLEWMDDPWTDVELSGEWLLDIEHRTRPDLVHLNDYVHGALPFRAPALVVGHSCVLSWWRAVRGGSTPERYREYRRRVARGLAGASMVVAPSSAMLASLRDDYGPLPPSRVVYNGRRSGEFVAAAKEPFIFSMGRLWDDAKNVTALDVAAAQSDWPVVVAGSEVHDGSLPRKLAHAQTLGQLDNEAVRRILARASIYALPARYEPFGLSVLEAALSGCALVLGDIPSLREIWGQSASFVSPDDPGELARELRRLIDDPERRARQAERARRTASEYTPERMMAGYVSAYSELMAEGEELSEDVRTVCA